jgi:hypothetical protein
MVAIKRMSAVTDFRLRNLFKSQEDPVAQPQAGASHPRRMSKLTPYAECLTRSVYPAYDAVL